MCMKIPHCPELTKTAETKRKAELAQQNFAALNGTAQFAEDVKAALRTVFLRVVRPRTA